MRWCTGSTVGRWCVGALVNSEAGRVGEVPAVNGACDGSGLAAFYVAEVVERVLLAAIA